MIVMPAIDIRDAACVQLVGGSYAHERVRLPDPAACARGWFTRGFQHLHVVDLDAATGRGDNQRVVADVVTSSGACVQVGGGVRTTTHVDALCTLGAHRVVVGTRALEDPGWLERIATSHPQTIVAAVDVRGRTPVVRGWSTRLAVSLADVLGALSTLPLAGVLVTAVDVEGSLRGPDLGLIDEVLTIVTVPLYAAGGIATLTDLAALRERDVGAAVLGMALYTGTLDADRVAQEYGT